MTFIYDIGAFSRFLGRLLDHARRARPAYVNLTRVTDVSQGAVMAIIAALETAKQEFHRTRISGNWPENERCRRLMVHSGFLNYLYRHSFLQSDTPEFFHVRSGTNADNITARELTDFYLRAAGASASKRSRSRLYASLIECMTNTREHAYGNLSRRASGRWWLMAHRDAERSCVQVSFFDNGAGIPTTVHKRRHETLLGAAGLMTPFLACKLLRSAMNGEERTSTGLPNRGKGLNWIYRSQVEGHINSLRVISNHAVFNGSTGTSQPLSAPLHGTLLSWTIPLYGADGSAA